MKISKREFLPSETLAVHASTIEWWEDHFVFAWFGGTREGYPDVSIYLYNLNNDGETIILGSTDSEPRWNPILFSHNNRLYLFEKIGTFCDRWQTIVHDITNWTEDITQKEIRFKQQIIPAGLNGPVKTRPVVYNNMILCGSSVETLLDWTSYVEAYIINNNKWECVGRSNPINVEEKKQYKDKYSGATRVSQGIIQPSLWVDKDNNLKSFFRSSNGLEKVYYSQCKSNLFWEKAIPTNIPNPNSSVCCNYINNELYLVYNPSNISRYPLNVVKISQKNDGGEFEILKNDDILTIADDETDLAGFSYPYSIVYENQIHLVYTFKRKKIEYCVIDL